MSPEKQWVAPELKKIDVEKIIASGGIFRIPKFRSMRTDAHQAATQLFGNRGAYLTPTGGFLRRRSLDELPLLFFALRGVESRRAAFGAAQS